MTIARKVYIISDLHIGGEEPDSQNPERVGFRMMTHVEDLARFINALASKKAPPGVELVINGDFIDLLAESHLNDGKDHWLPFIPSAPTAVDTFELIAGRKGDAGVFDALRSLLDEGHRLTVLLGNHDIELSMPEVRRALARRIAPKAGRNLAFLYDGEAYTIGNAIIEHGNYYDPANKVDHSGLRRVRVLQSRRKPIEEACFQPPVGSRIVAEVMNPIKRDFAFVDLLKPVGKPLFALLLALKPKYRNRLDELAGIFLDGLGHRLASPFRSYATEEISAGRGVFEGYGPREIAAGPAHGRARGGSDDVLRKMVASVWDVDDMLAASAWLGEKDSTLEEISFREGTPVALRPRGGSTLGLIALVTAGGWLGENRRLRMIQRTLRALQDPDQAFQRDEETEPAYLEAAQEMGTGEGRFEVIVLGHTHHAKDISLKGGARYLNSGTWANLMRFPRKLFSEDRGEATRELEAFFLDLKHNRLDKYLEFTPSYVRLDVGEDEHVMGAELCEFDTRTGVVP